MFNNTCRQYLRGIIALIFLGWAGIASAEWGLNMTEGVTPISKQVYDLHMISLWMVTIIGIGVYGAMIWSIFRHRKSKGAVAAQFHHSTKAEIIWTVIPIIILIAFAFPATKTLVAMEATEDADMTIKVTGYQWKWKYDYLDEGFSFFSVLSQESNDASQRGSGINPAGVDHYLRDVDNPVVIPVGKKVRILTTAADVIHAWWVPALGWKRDAIPGFVNDNWTIIDKPGVYRGQCAELCGKGHGYMPIVVRAVPEEEYLAWAQQMKLAQAEAAAGANKQWSLADLKTRGESVYTKNCVACHQVNGHGLPGAFPPLVDGAEFAGAAAMTGPLEEHGFWKDGKIVLGPLAKHLDIVLHGLTGTGMVAFGPQLNDVDIAAVITYERNSWGNATGDVLQPADVKAAR